MMKPRSSGGAIAGRWWRLSFAGQHVGDAQTCASSMSPSTSATSTPAGAAKSPTKVFSRFPPRSAPGLIGILASSFCSLPTSASPLVPEDATRHHPPVPFPLLLGSLLAVSTGFLHRPPTRRIPMGQETEAFIVQG